MVVVEVIFPNVGETAPAALVNDVSPDGMEKFGWLGRLKTSARNCSVLVSLSLNVFTTEGGLSTAKHRTFVHRRCPYIKVDVDFMLSDPKQSAVDERPTDTVSRISKPYLDWSIAD